MLGHILLWNLEFETLFEEVKKLAASKGLKLEELFAELGVREVQEMLRLDASESVTPETDAEPWLAQLIATLKG